MDKICSSYLNDYPKSRFIFSNHINPLLKLIDSSKISFRISTKEELEIRINNSLWCLIIKDNGIQAHPITEINRRIEYINNNLDIYHISDWLCGRKQNSENPFKYIYVKYRDIDSYKWEFQRILMDSLNKQINL
ncbi:MAG: hypothetical protein RR259_11240 [Odoribacter sp.]